MLNRAAISGCKWKRIMADLLLELYSEEIPARMQKDAELQYKQILEKYFAKHNIDYYEIEIFSGPCRITIMVFEINSVLKVAAQKIKGPNITANKNAIKGFCTKFNITETDLITKIIDGKEYYFYDSSEHEVKTKNILIDILPKVISSYIWPKSMKWGNYKISYVRPLKNILCLFDNKVLKFEYAHLESNDITFGHKFLSGSFKVTNIDSYKKILEKEYVVLDRNIRKKIILDQINYSIENKYQSLINNRLLEEVIGLVEYPKVLIGKIDKKFLSLPIEVIKLTLEIHQKYFIVVEKPLEKIEKISGMKLVDKFIFVANSPNHGKKVVLGNEKVLEARLSDAAYFYQLDLKTKITDYLSKLKQVIFHSKLGSMFDKTNRLVELVKFIKMNLKVKDNDLHNLEQAAKICKCDLVSNLVNELPKLQGIIGKYYAQNAKLGGEISEAISQHYKPNNIDDDTPEGISSLLALIDKTDSLVGLYIAGERATSTKDPYSLRRYAIGIIKIIIHNKIDINLKDFFKYSLKIYNFISSTQIVNELLEFLYDRFKNLLYIKYNKQLVNACYSENILQSFEKITIFSNHNKIITVISAYKRAYNICNNITDKKIDTSLFNTEYEKQLMEVINSSNLLNKSSKQDLDFCIQLSEKLNLLLDNVHINDENKKLTNNKMALIYYSMEMLNNIARWKFFL